MQSIDRTNEQNNSAKGFCGHLSMLAAWALAFGCVVGSDAFSLPWSTFLVKAGPFGTFAGILLGGLIMLVIAWNYHYMINRYPGSGGVYTYAKEAFGYDHAFISAWFQCLTYMAIVWLDAAVLGIMAHYMASGSSALSSVFGATGADVSFGNIAVSPCSIAVACAVCWWRRPAGRVETCMSLVLALGIVVMFAVALASRQGLAETMSPLCPQRVNSSIFVQILHIVAIAPWLFIGFESISHSSEEFRFPLKKSFGVMAAVLATSVVAYALLAAIPVFLPEGGESGADLIASVDAAGGHSFDVFDAVRRPIGRMGLVVVGITLFCAIFTNIIGDTIAASRLLGAMADDGVLPKWLSMNRSDGVPRNAVLAISVISMFVSALGERIIETIVDISIVGAGIAYAYTSAAAFKAARKDGSRLTICSGLLGLALSAAIIVLFVLPNISSDTMMKTGSYLVVVIWCLAGLVSYLSVFHSDKRRRFGRSTVVWISLAAIILLMSLMWIYETTSETTHEVFEDIVHNHAELCMGSEHIHENGDYDWQLALRSKLSYANKSITRNSMLQVALTALTLGLMFCLYSILRKREHEIELEKAKAKSYFFSTVSHDIRTPLNAIIGFSEMLRIGKQDEAGRKQALDAIIVSGKTLLGLINDVLDLSKLESGKMDIIPESVDCPLLMNELMDAMRISGGKSGVELRCRAGTMPLLMLDPQRFRQIVFNLVGNAVKFTEKGYIEMRATFTEATAGDGFGEFVLEVEDTGCGISEANLSRLGSAYVQVGSSGARNGGTGLGLAITKQLVAAMGGRLDVKSVLGRGSTFTITLPFVKISENQSGSGGGELAEVQSDSSLTARRILLVDDSKMNLMVMDALLYHIGDVEVVKASDGMNALDVLEKSGQELFDLVLTDLWMPKLDGEGLVKAIRANPALAGLRVIAVTADVEIESKAVEMGFDGVLFKPVTIANLTRLLAAVSRKGARAGCEDADKRV